MNFNNKMKLIYIIYIIKLSFYIEITNIKV